MKRIHLNLKRFDIPPEDGGVNRIAPFSQWGKYIVESTQQELKKYSPSDTEFVMYLPEAHLIRAVNALHKDSPLRIGSQGVYREDTAVGGGFGAFTTNRTANSVKAAGCRDTMIGHCEERRDKAGILSEAGVSDADAVDRLLNKEIKCAIKAGLKVLYCIGETSEEQCRWEETLKRQLDIGLEGVDPLMVTIAYEPVWAIGPGKTPPGREYIQKIARFAKSCVPGTDVIYGGGLKADNAEMLASIPEIDGGLIALTRFSGDIGFYPEEYLEIVRLYIKG